MRQRRPISRVEPPCHTPLVTQLGSPARHLDACFIEKGYPAICIGGVDRGRQAFQKVAHMSFAFANAILHPLGVGNILNDPNAVKKSSRFITHRRSVNVEKQIVPSGFHARLRTA